MKSRNRSRSSRSSRSRSPSDPISKIENSIERYHVLQAEIKELTEELEDEKAEIKKFMTKEKKKKIITNNFNVSLREMSREFIPDLPDDLWDKYKKVTKFTVLTVKKR